MQISFGRAIKVNTNLPSANNIFNRVNPAIKDVFDVLTGEDSSFLNEEKAKETREFLRKQFDDYSDETGVIYRTIDKDTFLFTGKDVQKVKDIDNETRKILKTARNFQSKKEIKEKRNETLLGLIEDGISYGKKYIELYFDSKDNENIDKIIVYKWPYEDDSLGLNVLDLNG